MRQRPSTSSSSWTQPYSIGVSMPRGPGREHVVGVESRMTQARRAGTARRSGRGRRRPGVARPIARFSAANIHQTGLRSRDRLDHRPGRLQPGFERGELGERDVGAFQLAGRGQHVGRERGERVLGDVDHREHVERLQRGLAGGPVAGNAVSGLPPVTNSARMFPASISSTSATAGHLTDDARKLRAGSPAGGAARRGAVRVAAAGADG